MILKHKVALITGAASGMGLEVAKLCAKEGATLIINDINKEKLKNLEDYLKGKCEYLSIVADISKKEDVKLMVEKSLSKFKKVDVLVNNGGICWFDKDADVVNLDEDIWERVLNTNLKSVYLCSKYVIPTMIENGGGSIVNLASSSALRGIKNLDAYTASKGGVLALTKSMAVEYAKNNIRVNSISPGSIYTPMTSEAQEKKGYPRNPLRRTGHPSEVANAILYFAADISSYTTGTNLPVDGGLDASQ